MKIILSPAKKMIVDTDNIAPVELPAFIDKTAEILSWMKSKSKEELKAMSYKLTFHLFLFCKRIRTKYKASAHCRNGDGYGAFFDAENRVTT